MPTDVPILVIGSGIAGLSFALKAAAQGWQVVVLTKKNRAESSTNYAQGGIASVTSATDDFELHVKDTLVAGDGLCDEAVVRTIVEAGPARIRELVEWGVAFSNLDDGRISLHREGGHTKRRILHVKDMTGRAIEEALLQAVAASPRITVHEHYCAIDLITAHKLARQQGGDPTGPDHVLGLYALNVHTGEVTTFRAHAVLLCTGGAGHVYRYTTNPPIATGDGIAMAYRIGATVRNMEFMQFHPTALFSPSGERFLISEAVRGEGGILRDHKMRPFMKHHDPRGDLAPRDIVARAIDHEIKRSGSEHVWLDITHKPAAETEALFPTIVAACRKLGIDPVREPIPVVPAAHYLCGGVATDLDGATDIGGVYAFGEVACTGLHGANRLASNSLLEAVVISDRAATAVDRWLRTEAPRPFATLPDWIDGDLHDSDERVVLMHNWEELQRSMWDFVGIVRTTKRLERAARRVQQLAREIHDYYWNFKVETRLLELRNLILVADLIIACAMQRRESRGLHHILDYPERLPAARNTEVRAQLTSTTSAGAR